MLSCRLLFVGKHKVYITAWIHWTSVWPNTARKLAVLSAVFLCLIWVFQDEWHSCGLYIWGESCRSRENLVCLGFSKGSLDSSWNLLQKAYALQGKSQLFKFAKFREIFLAFSEFFVIQGLIISELYLQSELVGDFTIGALTKVSCVFVSQIAPHPLLFVCLFPMWVISLSYSITDCNWSKKYWLILDKTGSWSYFPKLNCWVTIWNQKSV